MKDQLKLLRDCLHDDILAIVFQGDDKCLPEIMEAAISIYKRNGCSVEFLYDLKLLLNDVVAYQANSPTTVKLPKLSPVEKELIREVIEKENSLQD